MISKHFTPTYFVIVTSKGLAKRKIQKGLLFFILFSSSNWVYYLENKMRISYDYNTASNYIMREGSGSLFGTPNTLTWQLIGSPKYCFATPMAKRMREKMYTISK